MKFSNTTNMHRTGILILLLYTVGISNSRSQSLKKLVSTGDRYYHHGFYDEAAKAYQEAEKLSPNDLSITYKVGLALLEGNFKHRALPYLQKVHHKAPESPSLLLYHLGLAHQYNHQFTEALAYYQQYREVAKNTYLVDHRIQQCYLGIEYLTNPQDVKIVSIGTINSSNHDYAPLITADGSSLIFTSRRESSTGGKMAFDNNYYEDIYVTHRQKHTWSAPEKISENINTHYHECSAAISPDGTTLFLYVDEGDGDIYVSNLVGSEWSLPVPLNEHINSPYRELSVSISRDGTELYFSSNRPGGYGGFDIYVSMKDTEGQWSKPVNLGPRINTQEDEDAPFIHPREDMLYFSSTGHLGMGGYDIFRSERYQGKWSTPMNLGYPINNAQDNIYFVVSEDHTRGYYAAARENGLGGKDIYAVELNNLDLQPDHSHPEASMIKPSHSLNNVTYYSGTVADADTGEGLFAELVLTDNDKKIVIDRQYSDPITGRFAIVIPEGDQFGLTIEAEGYLFHSQHFDSEQLREARTIEKNLYLRKTAVGSVAILQNVFFNSGESTLKFESITELNRVYALLKTNPTLKIRVNGHTDDVGSAEYNQKLSEERAQAVAAYLQQYGISPNRIMAKGYGEVRPLVSNDDETEGREINRRTEIEIMSIGTPLAEQQKNKRIAFFRF